MHGMEIENPNVVPPKGRFNYKLLGLVIMGLLLLTGLIALIVYLTHRSSDELLQSCVSGPGYNAAKSYFSNPSNAGKVTISSNDFKPIVAACKGDVDRALLCIANYIAYEGIAMDTHGNRTLRYSPPPSAQHTVMSGYPVGACVLGDKTGTVYIGANFEFCSHLVNTVHGEQCAIHNAAVHGEPSVSKLAVNAAPCGVCRQFLVEIGPPTALDIIFCDNNGKFESSKLSSLLTSSFGPEDLAKPGTTPPTSLKHPEYYNVKDDSSDSEDVKEAKQMFRQAYAPYTRLSEGVVLQFKNGQKARGQSIENAAYNPGVSAFRGACSLAALKGYKMSDLTGITYACLDPGTRSNDKIGRECMIGDTLGNMEKVMKTLYSSQTFHNSINLHTIKIPLPPLPAAKGAYRSPVKLPL